MQYTKKNYEVLYMIHRKPRTAEWLQKKTKKDDGNFVILMDEICHLIKTDADDNNPMHGNLSLNERGETVLQAETDRRIDMYTTRILSLVSIVASVAALIFSMMQVCKA